MCTDADAMLAVRRHFHNLEDSSRAFTLMTGPCLNAGDTCFVLEHASASVEFLRRWSESCTSVDKQMAMRMWINVPKVCSAAPKSLSDAGCADYARVGMEIAHLPGRASSNALNYLIVLLCSKTDNTCASEAARGFLLSSAEHVLATFRTRGQRTCAALRAAHFGVATGYLNPIPVVEAFLDEHGTNLMSRTANVESNFVDVVVANIDNETLMWRNGLAAIAAVTRRQNVTDDISAISIDDGCSPLAKFVINFSCMPHVWNPDDAASAEFFDVLKSARPSAFASQHPLLNDHTATTTLLRAIIDAHSNFSGETAAKLDTHAAEVLRTCCAQPRTTMFHVADYKLAAKAISVGLVAVGLYVVMNCMQQTLVNLDRLSEQRVTSMVRWHIRHASFLMLLAKSPRDERVEQADNTMVRSLRRYEDTLNFKVLVKSALRWTCDAKLYEVAAFLLVRGTVDGLTSRSDRGAIKSVQAACRTKTPNRSLAQAAILLGVVPYFKAVPPYVSPFVTYTRKALALKSAWTHDTREFVMALFLSVNRDANRRPLPVELIMHIGNFVRYTDIARAVGGAQCI